MDKYSPPSPLPPDAIGDYRIVAALSETAYRALGPGDQAVILKLIDAECLQRGKLHPSVHLRLSRVRELANPGVANLHSVEKDKQYVFAVWDDIEGLPIDRYVQKHRSVAPAVARLARELILVVESLHNQGLVHGRINAGNVIVDSRGNVRLTQISPLLYDDFATDNTAVLDLLADVMSAAGLADSPLGEAVRDATKHRLPLRTLSARLNVSIDHAAKRTLDDVVDSDTGLRWSTLVLAMAFALLGVAITWLIYHGFN